MLILTLSDRTQVLVDDGFDVGRLMGKGRIDLNASGEPIMVREGWKPVKVKNIVCGVLRITSVTCLNGNELDLRRVNLDYDHEVTGL